MGGSDRLLLAVLFTGALVPLNRLGIVFDILKYLLPTTWGIDTLRAIIINDITGTFLLTNGTLPGMSLQAAIFFCLGLLLFNWGFRRSQIQGSLGTY